MLEGRPGGTPPVKGGVMTDKELIDKVKENHMALLGLLSLPYPDGDGAQLGYDGEVRSLEVDGDDLLEECDSRRLDRRYALHGFIKKERWLE